MLLGILSITGSFPLTIDGLSLGLSDRKTIRFRFTEDGFERGGKLYKTYDPQLLINAIGVREATYSLLMERRCQAK